jgi:glyoxylase-like metal-dependent hydrolase (beta-lactamase superfamily II)
MSLKHQSLNVLLAACVLCLLYGNTRGQPAPQAAAPGAAPDAPAAVPPVRPPSSPLQVHQVTPTLYWGEANGGNVGFVVGEKGVVVIDAGGSPARGQEFVRDIAMVTPKPIAAVILTHADGDHVAGLAAFPAGIQVIAQTETKKAMEAALAAGKAAFPADRLPNHVVAKRELADLAGVKVELLHWAPAHTAGDLVVFVPGQKVVFTGDLFCLDQPRALVHRDRGNAGTSEGWVRSAKATLALHADQFVVGHSGAVGGLQTREWLQNFVKVSADERAKVKALIGLGRTLPQIEAEVGDPPLGSKPSRFPPYSEVVYDELTGAQR